MKTCNVKDMSSVAEHIGFCSLDHYCRFMCRSLINLLRDLAPIGFGGLLESAGSLQSLQVYWGSG